MLSGDNGILQKATDAKIQTGVGQEKEALSLAWNSCMVNKTTKNEDITDVQLQNELKSNGYNNTSVVKKGNKFTVTFESGNIYTIKDNGTVQKYEKVAPTNIFAKFYNTDGILILSNTDYTDSSLGEYIDYGEISNKVDYYQDMTLGPPILVGAFPGWIDEKVYMPSNSKIKKVIIKDKIAPKNTSYWFCGCTNLTEIDGIENLNTSNVTNMKSMFYCCYSLPNLDVSNFDTENVTDMSNMFDTCYRFTTIDVTNFDTKNVTNMKSMFHSCPNLKNIDLRGFNVEKVTDMSNMFDSCSSLNDLDLSSFKTSNVTTMLSMFDGCASLQSLNISNFDTSKVTMMLQMFQNCSSLTSINVSSFNTSNVINFGNMFYGCTSLNLIDVSNFDTNKVSVAWRMFYNVECDVIIGNKWTLTESQTNFNGTFERKN